jgi:hypothetical protein
MYREGRGTWFNARYQLDRPSSYNLDFDRDEPRWQSPPPPQAYQDELRFFPRSEENTPEWLQRRVGALRPDGPSVPPGPRLRPARVFDGAGAGGRPTVNRLPVVEPDLEPLLNYLERGPVVRGGRGLDVDLLSPDSALAVPVAFHSDGTWLWPAAVPYYLRRYGVPPEPELVEHARSRGFQPPQDVDEPTRLAANALLDRPATPPRDFPPPGEQPPPAAQQPRPGFAAPPPGAPGAPGAGGAPPDETTTMLPALAAPPDRAPMAQPAADDLADAPAGPGSEPAEVRSEESFRPAGPGTADGGEQPAPGRYEDAPPRWEASYPRSPAGAAAGEPVEPSVRYASEDIDLFRPYQPPAEPEQPERFGTELDQDIPEEPRRPREPRYRDESDGYPAQPHHPADPEQFHAEPERGYPDESDRYRPEPEPRYDAGPEGHHADARRVELADEFGADEHRTAEEPDWSPVPTEDRERELAALRELFSDYDIPPSTYRIGELDPGAWSLVPDRDGWQVTRPARKPGQPVRFGELDDAAAYLIGRLVLESARGEHDEPQPAGFTEAAGVGDDGWAEEADQSGFDQPDEPRPEPARDGAGEPEAHPEAAEGPAVHAPELSGNGWQPGYREAEREEPDPAEHDHSALHVPDHPPVPAGHRDATPGYAAVAESGRTERAAAVAAPADEPAYHQATADEPAYHTYRQDQEVAAELDADAEAPPTIETEPVSDLSSELLYPPGHPLRKASAAASDAARGGDQGHPTEPGFGQEGQEIADAATAGPETTQPAVPSAAPAAGHASAAPSAASAVASASSVVPSASSVVPSAAAPPAGHAPAGAPGDPAGGGAPTAPLATAATSPAVPVGPAAGTTAAPASPMRPEEAGRPTDAAPDGAPAGGAPAQREDAAPRTTTWPIRPMPGEPPLTLFRHKRMVELGPGTELDRFGGPEGNLTYAVNTPFEQRSLVPEWVNRPYHVYRLLRPVEALHGIAVPWFEQPGGGSAYLLPHPVAELLADGSLVEVEWDGGVGGHQ